MARSDFLILTVSFYFILYIGTTICGTNSVQSQSEFEDTKDLSVKLTDLVGEVIQKVIGESTYQKDQVNNWIEEISKKLHEGLETLNNSFKYKFDCAIYQNPNAKIAATHFISWNMENGGTYYWISKHKDMVVLIDVYGFMKP